MGTVPSLEIWTGLMCASCVCQPMATNEPTVLENEALSWVSVPSTTFQLSFNQYIFPLSGQLLTAIRFQDLAPLVLPPGTHFLLPSSTTVTPCRTPSPSL